MRRGSFSEVLTVLVFALVLIATVLTLIYQFTGNSAEQYFSLTECGGALLTSVDTDIKGGSCFINKGCTEAPKTSEFVAGKDGKYTDPDIPGVKYEERDGKLVQVTAPTEFSWQYIGKGWGCENDQTGTEFCCLRVPAGEHHISSEVIVSDTNYQQPKPGYCFGLKDPVKDAACKDRKFDEEFTVGDGCGICRHTGGICQFTETVCQMSTVCPPGSPVGCEQNFLEPQP